LELTIRDMSCSESDCSAVGILCIAVFNVSLCSDVGAVLKFMVANDVTRELECEEEGELGELAPAFPAAAIRSARGEREKEEGGLEIGCDASMRMRSPERL
jgi:hypothetical protein